MSQKRAAIDRLIDKLGFDPRKSSIGTEVAEQALKEIREELDEKNKEEAKKLFREAIELSQKMAKARKEFENNEKKHEKGLGKIVGKIERLGNPNAPPQDEEENGGDESDS